MSDLNVKVLKGVSWLALYKFFSQMFSWGVTIVVARILVPDDYGLMAMSTIITSYGIYLSEMGLGAAIIQRKSPSQHELSSVFWFLLSVSLVLALSCIPISYITASIFDEPDVIPLTQTVAVVFLLAGFEIVPFNLIKKEIMFKTVGIIEMTTTIIASASMLLMANLEFGVWTLIMGKIIGQMTRVPLIFYYSKWRPAFHYKFKEVKPFITFGINVALGRTFFYIQEMSDQFFAGRAWQTAQLGLYAFALQLARIPTEKIVSLINQTSFPAFSKLQDDQKAFNSFYLNITKVNVLVVVPIFLGGFLVGEDLIRFVLNEKWFPMIELFKYLCLIEIFTAMNSINNYVHISQGRPNWSLSYNTVTAILMAVSFYFAVQFGFMAILIPWFTTYIFLRVSWMLITLRKLGIPAFSYVKNIRHIFIASALMFAAVRLLTFILHLEMFDNSALFNLVTKVITGGSVYLVYILFFEKEMLLNVKKMIRS
ncbi:MAG: lipopolysaccharide biosynthesis protein [Calditrichae bacterium]|nr:lipopolysaccharide biosynthesis protein [Calditrichia bacterium]